MKKLYLFIAIMGLIIANAFAQQEISGKSKPRYFKLNGDSQPKLPPNLSVKLQITEPSGDSLIEGGETATLKLNLTNKGKGTAQGLIVRLTDQIDDSSFIFEKEKEIGYLDPGKTLDINIPIKTDLGLKANRHILDIDIEESSGYNLDPSIRLILYTMEYRKPHLVFSGFEICDTCQGTSAIIPDNILQPGELAEVKIYIQNIGSNIARNVKYVVKSTDQNIKVFSQSGDLGNVAIGEKRSLIVFVSPNKKINSTQLPLFLSLSLDEEFGNLNSFPLPITLNKKPSENKIVEVKPTINIFEQQNAQTEVKSEKIKTDEDNLEKIEKAPFSKIKRSDAVAVVIGIENYSYFAKAPYAENDAKIIANYFKNTLGISDVIVYTSEQAKGFFFDNMLNLEYGELKKKVDEGARDVFVYFSGHGIPSLTGEIYLMPSDSKKDRLSNQGFSLTVFYENLQHLGARNVIVFLDACFSGITRQSEKIQSENLLGIKSVGSGSTLKDLWINNPSFSIFNSSASDGISYAYDQSTTGLFTYFICRGLQGEADLNMDHKITTGELEQYIQKKVMQTSEKIGGMQITQFHGNKDYVLVGF